MIRKRKLTKLGTVGTAVASAALVLAACGSSTTPPASSSTTTTTPHMVKVPGGTLTIAEAAAAGPNYIFPMMGGAYFSVHELPADLPAVPPAVLVRRRAPPRTSTQALSVAYAPVYSERRQDGDHQAEGLQVVER